ncbi:hypothetical protein SAMN05216436_1255 [bacterium A37T11]|nr:hypothetical protein SAMN05216436_1255 [bacterium A37T11]
MKPLHVPANFNKTAPIQEQIVFALAYLGDASSNQVGAKLAALDPSKDAKSYSEQSSQILKELFDKGLINGAERNGTYYYNLSKEVTAHTGNIDPEKLDVTP